MDQPHYKRFAGLSKQVKQEVWSTGVPRPDTTLTNPALEEFRVKCYVGPLLNYKAIQPDTEAPIIGTREVSFSFPSALLKAAHEPKAIGLDRGEAMRTKRGVQYKRCALVVLFACRQLDQASTFAVLQSHSTYFLSNYTDLLANFGHLNQVDLVDSFFRQSHKARSDITTRNQPSNLYWLKDGWLEELGTDAIAVWYVDGSELMVNLFILAVDQQIRSETSAPVTHILGFEGHAYQLQ